MLVSIILPTYNQAHTLPRAINSVLNQTYNNWELIIIDNHSNDNTDTIIKNYENPKIHLLKINNYGIIAKSRNLGIKSTKNKISCILIILINNNIYEIYYKILYYLQHFDTYYGL